MHKTIALIVGVLGWYLQKSSAHGVSEAAPIVDGARCTDKALLPSAMYRRGTLVSDRVTDA